MNHELRAIQQLGESLDPPAGQPPADLRRRVLTGALAHRRRRRQCGGITGLLRLPPLFRRLPSWLGVPATAAVAVLAVALFVVQALHTAAKAPPSARQADTPLSAVSSAPTLPGVAPDDAAQVLQLAARHSAARGWPTARPDQFVFSERVHTKAGSRRSLSVAWDSVDGTRDSVVLSRPFDARDEKPTRLHLPGCRNRRTSLPGDKPTRTVACRPEPALQLDLPTEVEAMHDHLYGAGGFEAETGWNLPADLTAFTRFARVVGEQSLSADVHAAAFRAAAKIPGLAVRRDAKDIAGRRGIAVTRTDRGVRTEVILDAKTYVYLGISEVVVDDQKLYPNFPRNRRGDVIYALAVLRIAVVDRVDMMP